MKYRRTGEHRPPTLLDAIDALAAKLPEEKP